MINYRTPNVRNPSNTQVCLGRKRIRQHGQIGKTIASMTIWLFTVDVELGYTNGRKPKKKKVAKVIINLKFVAPCWLPL